MRTGSSPSLPQPSLPRDGLVTVPPRRALLTQKSGLALVCSKPAAGPHLTLKDSRITPVGPKAGIMACPRVHASSQLPKLIPPHCTHNSPWPSGRSASGQAAHGQTPLTSRSDLGEPQGQTAELPGQPPIPLSPHTLSTHSGQGAAGQSPKFVPSDPEPIKMEAKTQDRREAACPGEPIRSSS